VRESLLILLILLASQSGALLAQDDQLFLENRHKAGFVAGYGNQAGWNVNYVYNVIFFEAQYHYSLLSRETWGLEILVQPQFNFARMREGENESTAELVKGYECGLNIALLIRRNFFSDRLSIYTSIGTGPHFVSVVPERQSEGYLFSDNLNFGIDIRIYHNFYLDVRSGIRHISNLGFKQPNYGVNSTIVTGGFFFVL
jgi:hypothetical protein